MSSSKAGKYQKAYKTPKTLSKFIAQKNTKTDLVNPTGGTQIVQELHAVTDAGTGTGFMLNVNNVIQAPSPNAAVLGDYMTITQVLHVQRNGTTVPTLSDDGLVVAQGTNAQNTLWFSSKVHPMNLNGNWFYDTSATVDIGTSRKLSPGDKLVLITRYKSSASIAGWDPKALCNSTLQFFEST